MVLLVISPLIIFLIIYQMYLIKKYKNINKYDMSYIATLTHDLKSPARAQINMLNLLLKGQFGELNPKQYEMLKLTCSSAKYMSNLVGTVLSDYKSKFTSLPINKSNFDFVMLVNSLIKQNMPLLEEKGLNVLFSHSDDKCMIFADKLQLERVVINLLSNAITYSFDNSSILMNLYLDNDNINFSISNKSGYIKNNEIKKVFSKFSSTKNSSLNKMSTGLGLYTVKQIIKLHNGAVFADSNPEGICTFGFKIPVSILIKDKLLEKNLK